MTTNLIKKSNSIIVSLHPQAWQRQQAGGWGGGGRDGTFYLRTRKYYTYATCAHTVFVQYNLVCLSNTLQTATQQIEFYILVKRAFTGYLELHMLTVI